MSSEKQAGDINKTSVAAEQEHFVKYFLVQASENPHTLSYAYLVTMMDIVITAIRDAQVFLDSFTISSANTRIDGVFINDLNYSRPRFFDSTAPLFSSDTLAKDGALIGTALALGFVYAVTQYYKQYDFNKSADHEYILKKINRYRKKYEQADLTNQDYETLFKAALPQKVVKLASDQQDENKDQDGAGAAENSASNINFLPDNSSPKKTAADKIGEWIHGEKEWAQKRPEKIGRGWLLFSWAWDKMEEATMWFWIFWYPLALAASITGAVFLGPVGWALLGLTLFPLVVKFAAFVVEKVSPLDPEPKPDPELDKENIRKAGKKMFIDELYRNKCAANIAAGFAAKDNITADAAFIASVNTEFDKLLPDDQKNKDKRNKILNRYKPKKDNFLVAANGLLGFAKGFFGIQFLGWGLTFFISLAGVALFSNPITIAIVALAVGIPSLIAGCIFIYRNVTQTNDKQNEEIELENFAESKSELDKKLETLAKLEYVNKKLKKEIIKAGHKPLKMPQPHEDRCYRRLSEKPATFWTYVKKTLNRLLPLAARTESGILVARLLLLGGCLVSIFVAVSFPVFTGVAVGLAVLFAAAAVYKYHQESKREKEKRLIEDVDVRTQSLVYENDLLKQQLKSITNPEPASAVQADVDHTVGVNPHQNLQQEQEPGAVPVASDGKGAGNNSPIGAASPEQAVKVTNNPSLPIPPSEQNSLQDNLANNSSASSPEQKTEFKNLSHEFKYIPRKESSPTTCPAAFFYPILSKDSKDAIFTESKNSTKSTLNSISNQ